MRLYTAAQMQEADRRAEEAGVSPSVLMEGAGSAVTARLRELYPATPAVLVLCGKGNNGGDGYVVARQLLDGGPPVTVLELSDKPATRAAAAARTALWEAGGRPEPLTLDSLRAWLDDHCGEPDAAVGATIVDALLGSGLDRPLRDELAAIVETVNRSACKVLAVDVPTGIDSDSARDTGPHVMADATVQLAGPKVASFFHPARAAYASAPGFREKAEFVADIGVPRAVLEDLSDVTVLDEVTVAEWLPERPVTAHKYQAGTVAVVAGSQRYQGAAELACRGAWRGGAGLVTLVAEERPCAAWPETIFARLKVTRPSAQAIHSGSEEVGGVALWPPPGLEPRHAAACVVGPGLDPGSLAVLEPLLEWAPGPLVLDAGALVPEALLPLLAGGSRREGLVVTPHAAEAARLLSLESAEVTAQDVTADPLGSARRLHELTGAVVVLKGPTTVVAGPDGSLAVSSRGHPGMASGGTGDVLAGLIGAQLAAPGERSVFQRVCVAVFVHGVAGERASGRFGHALVANDLVEEIAPALVALGWW